MDGQGADKDRHSARPDSYKQELGLWKSDTVTAAMTMKWQHSGS